MRSSFWFLPALIVVLDASASRDKYDKPSFIARHIFPANHAFLAWRAEHPGYRRRGEEQAPSA